MKLLTNSLVYTAVTVLKSGIGIFILPIYSVYLSTEDYGIVGIVSSTMQVLSIIAILSLNGAGVRYHYELKDTPEKQRRFWGTIFYFVILNAAVSLTLIGLFHDVVLLTFIENIPFYPYLLVGLVSCFFEAGYQMFQSFFKVSQRGGTSGIIEVFHFIINITVSLILVIAFDKGAIGVILGTAAANTCFGVASIFYFRGFLSGGPDTQMLGKSLRYSLPLLPHALAGWAMTLIDRLFLNSMMNTAEAGIYTAGFQIANVLHIFMVALNQAYSPWFFEKTTEGESGLVQIRKFSEMFVLCFTVLGVFVSLFTPELLKLTVTKAYQVAWDVTPFLAFAFVSRSIYFMVVGPVFIKKVKLVPIITITGAVANMGLNWLLIEPFGRLGAAGASFATMLLTSVIALFLSKRVDDFGYPWAKMFTYVLVGFALSQVVFLSNIAYGWLLAIKAGIALLILAGLYWRYGNQLKAFYLTMRKKRTAEPNE